MTMCSIVYLAILWNFFYNADSDKMRTILAIVVISCFFVVASSQSSDCINRATDVATCISRLGTSTDIDAFCNECGNKLVNYYNDCAGGAGVDAVKQGKFLQLIIKNINFAARFNSYNNVT